MELYILTFLKSIVGYKYNSGDLSWRGNNINMPKTKKLKIDNLYKENTLKYQLFLVI